MWSALCFDSDEEPPASDGTADATGAFGAVADAVVANGYGNDGNRPAFAFRPTRVVEQRGVLRMDDLGLQFYDICFLRACTIHGEPGSGKTTHAPFRLLAALQEESPQSTHGIAVVMELKEAQNAVYEHIYYGDWRKLQYIGLWNGDTTFQQQRRRMLPSVPL